MAKKNTKFNNYSPEIKKEAVEVYLNGKNGGLGSVCKKYGIRDKHTLRDWIKKYKKDPESLKVDGRYLRKTDDPNKGRPKKIDLEFMSKDEQIEYLKMENDILKKRRLFAKITESTKICHNI